MKPVHLRITNFYEPIGIDRDPVFAWSYTGHEGARQTAWRLVIAPDTDPSSGLLYDSGKVVSPNQNNIAASGPAWPGHTRLFARVCAWDQDGHSAWSDWTSFVTGLFPADRQNPVWITAGAGDAGKPYYAARRWTLGVLPETAFLSICGLGQFVAWLNGTKIGRHELDPGWTDYNKQTLYVTFDVAPYLKRGENTLVVEVANGWYRGDTADGRHFYTQKIGYRPFGAALPLWLQLDAGGSEPFRLQADRQWLTWPSQTLLANVYGSEDIDRTERIGPDLDRALADGLAHPARQLGPDEQPAGPLTAQSHPPVVVRMTYEGQLVHQPSPGVLVYDLGQNMAGLFEIRLRGRKGQRVVVRASEHLHPDGSGQAKPIVPTWSAYRLSGDPAGESFRPAFSYAAGRYVQVEGVSLDADDPERPELLGVQGHFVSSAARPAGRFACSDQRLNQVHDLVLRAIESNLNHVHTDCPTFEKLGWLEASQQMAPSIMYSKDVDSLWSKIARDAMDSQYGPDERDVDCGVRKHTYGPGLVTSIAPRYGKFDRDWGQGSYWDIVPWGSVIILGPWQQFRFYGNRRILSETYPAAARYLAYLDEKYERYPELYNTTGPARFLCHGLGDWGIGDAHNKSRENTETAFFYHDLVLMARIADLLDKPEDADRYRRRAEAVRGNYNEHLLVLDPTSGDWCYRAYDVPDKLVIRQVNQALPLQFGLVPTDKKASVARSFIASASGGVLNSGEIGLRFLFNTLQQLGRPDLVYRMVMQEEHPSYARFVRKGETTLPEYWADTGRSRNHDMMGQVMEWLYMGLLGLSSEDGYSHMTISPLLPPDLDWVEGSYEAITGPVRIRFEQTKTQHRLEVAIPDNTRARLVLPGRYSRVLCNHIAVPEPNRPLDVVGGIYELTDYLEKEQA